MITDQSQLTPAALDDELNKLARRIGVAELEESFRFPRFFQIETTRLCNARCPFCAINQWDKSTPFMADELWERIAAELIEHKDWIRFADLQRAGEPLLDKRLPDRVRQLKEGGLKHIAISTNASALNEANAIKLLEAGIDEVMMSIDSVVREKYESLRVGLKFDKVIANIRRFFELRDRIRPDALIRVRAVCVYDADEYRDRSEMEAWEQFWAPLRKERDRIYMKRVHSWGNQKQVEGAEDTEGETVYHPCIIPWSTMHITAMGRVALCPHDYDGKADLGDLNTQSIAEVWRGEKLNRVRRLHATGLRNDLSFCQGCRSFDEELSLERDTDKAAKRTQVK